MDLNQWDILIKKAKRQYTFLVENKLAIRLFFNILSDKNIFYNHTIDLNLVYYYPLKKFLTSQGYIKESVTEITKSDFKKFLSKNPYKSVIFAEFDLYFKSKAKDSKTSLKEFLEFCYRNKYRIIYRFWKAKSTKEEIISEAMSKKISFESTKFTDEVEQNYIRQIISNIKEEKNIMMIILSKQKELSSRYLEFRDYGDSKDEGYLKFVSEKKLKGDFKTLKENYLKHLKDEYLKHYKESVIPQFEVVNKNIFQMENRIKREFINCYKAKTRLQKLFPYLRKRAAKKEAQSFMKLNDKFFFGRIKRAINIFAIFLKDKYLVTEEFSEADKKIMKEYITQSYGPEYFDDKLFPSIKKAWVKEKTSYLAQKFRYSVDSFLYQTREVIIDDKSSYAKILEIRDDEVDIGDLDPKSFDKKRLKESGLYVDKSPSEESQKAGDLTPASDLDIPLVQQEVRETTFHNALTDKRWIVVLQDHSETDEVSEV